MASKDSVVYKCNKCNRIIKLQRNDKGLEVIGKCVITSNCDGHMSITKNSRERKQAKTIPDAVTGLMDWNKQGILYTHNQRYPSNLWVIPTRLTTAPSVFVYRTDDMGNYHDIKPLRITYSTTQVEIEFDRMIEGIAQLVNTSSVDDRRYSDATVVTQEDPFIQLSSNGELTIATRNNLPEITVRVNFLSDNELIISADLPATLGSSFETSWGGTSVITINGEYYYVRSIRILDNLEILNLISNGSIKSGELCTIDMLDNTANRSNYIIWGNRPFTSYDRETSKYIDLSIDTEFTWRDNDVVAATTHSGIKSTYPPILLVNL